MSLTVTLNTNGTKKGRQVGYVKDADDQICGYGNAHLVQNDDGVSRNGQPGGLPEYMKTREAAMYLRKSVSWLVKRHDIAYVKGVPNIYKRKDLDSWFERNKFQPSLN